MFLAASTRLDPPLSRLLRGVAMLLWGLDQLHKTMKFREVSLEMYWAFILPHLCLSKPPLKEKELQVGLTGSWCSGGYRQATVSPETQWGTNCRNWSGGRGTSHSVVKDFQAPTSVPHFMNCP